MFDYEPLTRTIPQWVLDQIDDPNTDPDEYTFGIEDVYGPFPEPAGPWHDLGPASA